MARDVVRPSRIAACISGIDPSTTVKGVTSAGVAGGVDVAVPQADRAKAAVMTATDVELTARVFTRRLQDLKADTIATLRAIRQEQLDSL